MHKKPLKNKEKEDQNKNYANKLETIEKLCVNLWKKSLENL